MRLGVFAKVFSRPTVEECLGAVRATGLDAVQFNLSVVGLDTVPETVPEPILDEVREVARRSRVELAALSGTFNAAHPDPAVRELYVNRFHAVCQAAAHLGIPVVTLSTGSRDPEDMWRWHPDNSSPEAWADSRQTLTALAAIARDHGIRLAFEPERNNVVSTAALALAMLEEIGSEQLGTVFDAANLLTEEILASGGAEATIREAASLLEGTILLAHAKELSFTDAELPAGAGPVPWRLVAEQLRDVGYDGPLVIHGLKERDVPAAIHALTDAQRQETWP